MSEPNEDLVMIDLPASDAGNDLVTIEYEAPVVELDPASKEVSSFRDVPKNINAGSSVDPYSGKEAAPIVASQEEADKANLDRYVLDGTETRQAEANLIGGKAGGNARDLSPDGMTINNRQVLINQELAQASKLAFGKPRQEAFDRVRKLERIQDKHKADYANWLESLVTDKPVDFFGEDNQIRKTGTRAQKAISIVANKEAEIDKVINNKAFRNWAAKKNIIVDDNSNADQKVRTAAEEFLSSTPTNLEYTGDLFKRAYDSAVSIGPAVVGSLGIALRQVGAEDAGIAFEELAQGADVAATNWEDPRKVSGAKEFGRNLASGAGSVATTIIPGAAVVRGAKIAGAGQTAVKFLTTGYTLGSGAALSGWDQYKDARANGATEDEAAMAAGLAAITQAPMELISPVPKWLNKLGGNLKQQAMKKLYEGTIDALQEASTETAQTISSNVIAQRIYDKDRSFWEGVETSAGVGGITGMVTSLLVNAATKGKANNPRITAQQKKEDEATEEIDRKAAEIAVDDESLKVKAMMEASNKQDEIKQKIEENNKKIASDVEGKTTDFLKEQNVELQKQYDEITSQIGSLEGTEQEITKEEKVEKVKTIDEQLSEIGKELEATDENDTEKLDEINARQFDLLDQKAQLKARETIDPQSQEPVTSKSERSAAQTKANIKGNTSIPVNRPTIAQVITVQKKVNQIIGKMFVGGTQQKRAAKVKASIKKAVNENIQFIAGTDAQVISADDYNETAEKENQLDPETYHAVIGEDGQLFLVLPNVGAILKRETETETRAASKEAAADQLVRKAPKTIEEEVIHLAMLHALKESNPDRSGTTGSDIRYVQERITKVAKELRKTNPKSVPALAGVYLGDKEADIDDYTLGTEMVRVVLQRLRTGQITEDVEAIQRAEQEVFTDADRNAILSFKNAIVEALIAIRDTITRYLNPKTSTPEMKRILAETESILDRFSVVAGKENNVTYKDYSDAAPKPKPTVAETNQQDGEESQTEGETTEEVATEDQQESETTLEEDGEVVEETTSETVEETIVNDKPTALASASRKDGEKVVKTAFKLDNGTVVSKAGVAHFQMIDELEAQGQDIDKLRPDQYGFETNTGRFVGREEAAQIQNMALKNAHSSDVIATEKAINEGDQFMPSQPVMYNGPMGSEKAVFIGYGDNKQNSIIKLDGRNVTVPNERVTEVVKPLVSAAKKFFTESQIEEQRKEVVEKATRVFSRRAEVGITRSKNELPSTLYRNGPIGVYSEWTGDSQRLSSGRGTGVATGTYAYQTREAYDKENKGEPTILAGGSNPVVVSFDATNDKLFGETVSLKGTNKAYMFGATARNLLALAEGKPAPTAIYYRFDGPKFPSTSKEIARALSEMLKTKDGRPINIESYSVDYAIQKWQENKSPRKVHPLNILLSRKGHGGIEYAEDVQGDNGEYGAVVFPPIDNNGNAIGVVDLDSTYSASDYDIHFNEYAEKQSDKPLVSSARKRGEIVSERISNRAIDDLIGAAEVLAPKRDVSGKEKVSQVTTEGSTFPVPLVSPYADSVDNTYVTTNSANELRQAQEKLQDMPGGFDIFRAARDVAYNINHGLTVPQQFAFLAFANNTLHIYKEEYLNSNASQGDKANFADSYVEIASQVEKKLTELGSESGQVLNFAKMLRSLGSPGKAAKMARDMVRGTSKLLKRLLDVEFHKAASEVRGARNKSLDTVMADGTLIANVKRLLKQAKENPEKLAADIRKNFANKRTLQAREIVLSFASKIFSKGSENVIQMIVDQTASILMTGGTSKTITKADSQKFINNAIAQVTKDVAKGKASSGKVAGSLEKLKAVIGNEKTRLDFVNALEKEVSKKYGKNQIAFEQEFGETFERMRDSSWSEALRNQSIKDVAQLLNFKHEDLFGYLGEKRNANAAEVKAHFQKVLSGIATPEQIEQFTQEVDQYLTKKTAEILSNKLSLTIDDKVKPAMNKAIKEVGTSELFKAVKSIKDIAKLSFSQTKSFKEAFVERVISDVGLPEKESRELAQLLETNLTTAILAQKNANLESAIKKAKKAVEAEGIKPTKASVEKALIENAFKGVFSSFDVYEAFRETHKFPKDFMPYSHELENELLAWGEKAMNLPEGDARNREQQKMMRYYSEQAPVSLMRDTLPSWWYMSLLTGIGTYGIVNPLASVVNIIGNIATWSLLNPTNPSVGINMAKGMLDMMLDKNSVARQNFAYVMETGLNPSGAELRYPKVDAIENAGKSRTKVDPITKFVQTIVKGINIGRNVGVFGKELSPRAMLRSLRATDAYFRAISEEIVARRLGYAPDAAMFEKAKQQAESEYVGSGEEESVKRREIMMRASEIYNDNRIQSETDRQIIVNDSQESVFGEKPKGLAGHIAGLIEGLAKPTEVAGFPVSTLIVPFTRVVANAFNSNINYTPIGAVRGVLGMKGVRQALGLKGETNDFVMGRTDKALELGVKSAFGTFVAAMLLFKPEEEDKTEGWDFYGTGPLDPKEAKIWREAGGKPYTFRFGKYYVPYQYSPLAIPVAAADLWRELEKKEDKSKKQVGAIEKTARVIMTPFAAGTSTMMDQSFFTGVSDLVEAIQSKDPVTDFLRIIKNIGSRAITPGFIRDANGIYTDKKYETENMAASLLMEFPGINAVLGEEALNMFGDPISVKPLQAGPISIPGRISGRLISEQNSSLAMQVLLKNNLEVSDWRKTARWGERDMSYQEKRAYIQSAGPELKQFLEQNAEDISAMPNEEAQALLDNVLTQIRAKAKADVSDQFSVDFQGNSM